MVKEFQGTVLRELQASKIEEVRAQASAVANELSIPAKKEPAPTPVADEVEKASKEAPPKAA